jgi:GNAT superfamily N-acetyltransferase
VEPANRSWRRGAYVIDTDRARVDLDVVHAFLSTSYWAQGIPRDVVKRSIDGALCFGVYRDDGARAGDEQVGFARVITDYATYAYVGDVFVLEPHRGRGLSKWLMECMTAHPDLQGLRRWMLATRDAHGLYRQYGFTAIEHPDRWMHRWDRDVYARGGPER